MNGKSVFLFLCTMASLTIEASTSPEPTIREVLNEISKVTKQMQQAIDAYDKKDFEKFQLLAEQASDAEKKLINSIQKQDNRYNALRAIIKNSSTVAQLNVEISQLIKSGNQMQNQVIIAKQDLRNMSTKEIEHALKFLHSSDEQTTVLLYGKTKLKFDELKEKKATPEQKQEPAQQNILKQSPQLFEQEIIKKISNLLETGESKYKTGNDKLDEKLLKCQNILREEQQPSETVEPPETPSTTLPTEKPVSWYQQFWQSMKSRLPSLRR